MEYDVLAVDPTVKELALVGLLLGEVLMVG